MYENKYRTKICDFTVSIDRCVLSNSHTLPFVRTKGRQYPLHHDAIHLSQQQLTRVDFYN